MDITVNKNINKIKYYWNIKNKLTNRPNESNTTLKTSHLPYYAYRSQFLSFKGNDHQEDFNMTALEKMDMDSIENLVKTVKKEYQGAGLYEKNLINWDKVGWNNLKKEPLDWTTATKEDVLAFWHALALAETKENSWVKNYNPTNVPQMLATYHTLVSAESKNGFVQCLNELNAIPEQDCINKILNKPLINPETGKLNIDFTVFDTETTGVNTNPAKGKLDRIIQIGAAKFKDGEINPTSALSQYINPEMHIAEGATAVHHITDDMLNDKPVINNILSSFVNKYLQNDLIVAYNSKFDIAMLNNAIDSYNRISANELEKKKQCLTIDPFIMIQRIHPYLGTKKTLSEQYKFIFASDIEGAHNALDDVKATSDVLKYCCSYLNKHFIPSEKHKNLTVKDLLTFQFGGKVDGLKILLDTNGCNQNKNFKNSYRLVTMGLKNFPDGYMVTEPKRTSKESKQVISELKPLVGGENAQILFDEIRNKHYKRFDNFEATLEASGIKGYGDKSRKEIIEIIADRSKQFITDFVSLWIKNSKPEDRLKGNDLPDIEIIRDIFQDRNNEKVKTAFIKGSLLKDVLERLVR